MPNPSRQPLSWLNLLTHTALAVYAYVFMEWLFFATQASFMDALSFGKKLELFLQAALLLAAPALLIQLIVRLLGLIPGPSKRWQVFPHLAAILPAVIYACLGLLMLDNFSYALAKFGIITSRGILRGGYALLIAAFSALGYWQVLRSSRSITPSVTWAARPRLNDWQEIRAGLAAALLAISLVVGLFTIPAQATPADEENTLLQRNPHIILIGSDGLVAQRMSLYGYERATTPFLDKLAETSLVAENNWSNAAATTGSVFSILTGKYPATTRLLYSPDILQGADAYQHLPGMLERAGYRTVEIAFPYYVDAYTINMQDGFDEVNGRSLNQSGISQLARHYHLENLGYFLPRMYERISDRLLHIFFIRLMPDPYRQVIQPINPNSVPQFSDNKKISDVLRLLRSAEQPLFVHVHLMGTHGEKFTPSRRVFSAGKKQTLSWMRDFYDDSVLDFDTYIRQLVKGLENSGLLDQTILIIYSDHADQWRADAEIPLVFRFPRGEYAGRIANNTQNLDIAPTLLDYLGMHVPAWMPGQSLLKGEPARARPIISASVVDVECKSPDWWCVIDPKVSRPPFYQFSSIQVVICQRMYTLQLKNDFLNQANVKGHPDQCTAQALPSREEVREIIRDHLRANGFDVSTLK